MRTILTGLRSLSFMMIMALGLMLAPVSVFAQESAQQVGADTALNWSGYVSQGGQYTAVSGSWVVPTVSVTADNQADATWVGIGGVVSHDLIQAGTQALPNSSGGISYEAWYELLPGSSHTIPLAVHPGDSVSVSVTQESETSGTWLISFRDNTTNNSYSTTVQYASSLSSVDWIEEMPAGVGERIALDDFGTVDFSGGSTIENGVAETIAGSNAQSLTMANDESQALVIPSVLGNDGASFSVTRTDAASDSIGLGSTGIDGFGQRSFSMPTPTPSSSSGTSTTVSLPGGFTITYYSAGGTFSINTGSSSSMSYPQQYRRGGRHSYSYSTGTGNGAIRISLLNDFFRL